MDPSSMKKGDPPPFHTLDEYVFQNLCRDLFDNEPGITSCYNYGTRGQSQAGIDLLSYRKNKNGIEVGQCKCLTHITVETILTASNVFFENWNTWGEKQVKKFILFVACDISKRQLQDEILKQKERFLKLNIGYEVWCAKILHSKLRQHPEIVRTYLAPPDVWVEIICGKKMIPSYQTSDTKHQASIAVLSDQVDKLSVYANTTIEKELDKKRHEWYEGKKDIAISWVKKTKNDQSLWITLANAVKAKILNFEASLSLDDENEFEHVEKLINEAAKYDAFSDQSRLKAFLAYKRNNREEAFRFLTTHGDATQLNLKAALLLDMGYLDKCQHVFDDEFGVNYENVSPNAETYRVQALFNLAKKQVNEARLLILKAKELEPTWENIKVAHGMINYYSSLALTALPAKINEWPEPIDWRMVKRDDDTRMYLREAAEIFMDLIASSQCTTVRKNIYKSWYLSCLLNDDERLTEAIEYCKRILSNEPTDYRALSWILARNINIEIDPNIKRIVKLTRKNQASFQQILVLVDYYLLKKRTNKAVILLNKTKILFDNQDTLQLWYTWYIHALCISKDFKTANKKIEECPNGIDTTLLNEFILEAETRNNNEPNRYITFLKLKYDQTNNPQYLLAACEHLSHNNDWQYIAKHSEDLVTNIGTIHAVRLAAYALFHSNNFEQFIKIIDNNTNVFPLRKVPADLRRMRIQSLVKLGLLPEAIAESERLVHEAPTTQHLIDLVRIYLLVGSKKELSNVAHKLLHKDDLNSELCLQFSTLLKTEDINLAVLFWKKAINIGIAANYVSQAITIGFQLGLDNELKDLYHRMELLSTSGSAGIQKYSIEEMISLMNHWNQDIQKLSERYDNGSIPIHILTGSANILLVNIYHRSLKEIEDLDRKLQSGYLLARHGGKVLATEYLTNLNKNRIYLDITSLLLAEHLDIMEVIEISFGNIRISFHAISALSKMRELMYHPQPTRLKALQRIAQLINYKKIKVFEIPFLDNYSNIQLIEEMGENWVKLMEYTKQINGYLVDFLPLKTKDLKRSPQSLSQIDANVIINIPSILQSVLRDGHLSENEYNKALAIIGEKYLTQVTIPENKSTLIFHDNTIVTLALWEQFSIICENFQIQIENSAFNNIIEELKENNERESTGVWLANLIARIRHGLDRKSYSIIPQSLHRIEEFSKVTHLLDFTCLLELLKCEHDESDVVCIDDRYLNSFMNFERVPIISMYEIMKALVSSGHLTIKQFYEKLLKLRSGNVLFIPIETDEILFHLNKAQIDNDSILETYELKIIRQYIAFCLIKGKILQIPPVPDALPNKNGELTFIINLAQVVNEAIIEIWISDEPERNIIARSEWIVRNIYMNHLGLYKFTSISNVNDQYIYGVSLTILFIQAVRFPISQISGQINCRKTYFKWLYDRLLSKRFESDDSIKFVIVDRIKKAFTIDFKKVTDHNNINIANSILQLLYNDLPEIIKNELLKDQDFIREIGLNYSPIIHIDDLVFDYNEFLIAVHKLVNHNTALILTNVDRASVTFNPTNDKENITFYFNHPNTNKKINIDISKYCVLFDSITEQETFLKQKRAWFDTFDRNYHQAIVQILSYPNSQDKITEIEKWINTSGTLFYTNLADNINKTHRINFTELIPPDIHRLLQHLRIQEGKPGDTDYSQIFSAAAQFLIKDENWIEAFRRLSGIPVPLPYIFINTLRDLLPAERHNFIKQLLRTTYSPVSRFHLIYIISNYLGDYPAYVRLIRLILRNLFNDQTIIYHKAFISLLRYFNEQCNHWKDSKDLSTNQKLIIVWSHTHRIYNTFISGNIPPAWIIDTFSNIDGIHSSDFHRDPEQWFNIAQPRNIDTLSFIFDGISYAVSNKVISIIDDNLRQFLSQKVVFKFEETKILGLEFLRSPVYYKDTLGSFLGGDRGKKLLHILNDDIATSLTHESLQIQLNNVIQHLMKSTEDLNAWTFLYALLGELPPPFRISDDIKYLMLNIDLLGLYKQNLDVGNIALLFSAQQTLHNKDQQVRDRIKKQIFSVAKYYSLEDKASIHNEEGKDKLQYFLIEGALNLSLAIKKEENPIIEFHNILNELITIHSRAIPLCESLVTHIIEELPIADGQHFYPLLNKIRLLK